MYGTRGTLQQGKKPPPQEVASTFSCLQENASNTVPGYPEGFTPPSHGPKALMLKAGIGAEGDPGPPRAIDSQVCLIPGLPHSWPVLFLGGEEWGDVSTLHPFIPSQLRHWQSAGLGRKPTQPFASAPRGSSPTSQLLPDSLGEFMPALGLQEAGVGGWDGRGWSCGDVKRDRR